MLLKTCRSILSVVLQNKCSEEFHKIPTKDLKCENFLKNIHLAKGSFQRNFTNFTYLQNTSKHKIRFRNIAFWKDSVKSKFQSRQKSGLVWLLNYAILKVQKNIRKHQL